MCVARIFFYQSFWFLRQIPVIIRQCLHAPLQIAYFTPNLSSWLVPVGALPSVCRGEGLSCGQKVRCANQMGGVDLNM